MDLNAVGGFVEHVGLPVAMLVAFGWWIVTKDKEYRADAEALRQGAATLEGEHRIERTADREAYLAALDKMGLRLEDNTKSLDQLGTAVRDQARRTG